MKQHVAVGVGQPFVAPLVGAWIETLDDLATRICGFVAPLVGAWIETLLAYAVLDVANVAPLVGAWIETVIGTMTARPSTPSPLSWGRGLKLRACRKVKGENGRPSRGGVD